MNPFQPSHKLLTVTAKITLPPAHDLAGPVHASVRGESETKRVPLWIESNVWDYTDEHRTNHVVDWCNHVLLSALQDRPNTPERMLFSLTGGLGAQDRLPF